MFIIYLFICKLFVCMYVKIQKGFKADSISHFLLNYQ